MQAYDILEHGSSGRPTRVISMKWLWAYKMWVDIPKRIHKFIHRPMHVHVHVWCCPGISRWVNGRTNEDLKSKRMLH